MVTIIKFVLQVDYDITAYKNYFIWRDDSNVWEISVAMHLKVYFMIQSYNLWYFFFLKRIQFPKQCTSWEKK